MTTEEKVNKIYAKVYNGLSENVAETRADVKRMSANLTKFERDFAVYIATRGQTCPFATQRAQFHMQRKSDVKYIITALLALGAVATSIVAVI